MQDDSSHIESSAVERIYESAVGDGDWRRALPEIASHLGCQGVGISYGLPEDRSPGHMILGAKHAGAVLASSPWQNLILDDPIPFAELETGKVYGMSELLDPAELKATAFYRELLEPAGYTSFLCIALGIPDAIRVRIFLYRDRAAGPFRRGDVERCQALVPHMQLALRVVARIQQSGVVSATHSDAIDRLGVGAILLDHSRRVVHVNRCGRTLAEEEDSPIRISDGRFRLRGTLGSDFEALFNRVVSRQDDGFQEAMAVPRRGLSPLGLLVRSSEGARSNLWSGPCAVVYLSDPTASSMTPEGLVSELFGLSPAEARLAARIAAGLTLTDAAFELGLSEASARTYSKRIYSKVGVCRQADLVRLLLRSVATLAIAR